MSMEILETVALAEEKARQVRAAAAAEAKRAAEAAREAAELVVAAAEGKAEGEIRELIRKADEKARENAQVLASGTKNREAAMRAHADRKMEQVVCGIVERIVNG